MKSALFLLLLSSIAHAEGFYVEGGLSAFNSRGKADSGTYYVRDLVETKAGPEFIYRPVEVDGYWRYDVNEVRNPYGSFALGYDYSWRSFSFDLNIKHQSSIVVSDRGRNSISLDVRWYPFK